MKKSLGLLVIPFFLAACGSKFNGLYENSDHTMKFNFESADKVIVDGYGASNMEFTYTIDGKLMKLQLPDGTRVLQILDDGSIFMKPDIILKKKS